MSKITKAYLLCAPMLVFLAVFFFAPVSVMLSKSVWDTRVVNALPETVESLRGWDHHSPPGAPTYASFGRDIMKASPGALSDLGARLNQDIPGFRGLMSKTSRSLRTGKEDGLTAQDFEAISPVWSEPATWAAIADASSPWTLRYLLASIDLRVVDGRLEYIDRRDAIYRDVLLRSLWVSFVTAILTICVSYPLAYYMSLRSEKIQNILFILVLLPFWTSTLVNTFAWFSFFKQGGVLSVVASSLFGLESVPSLLFTRTAVYIGFVQLLMPVATLPMFAGMKNISPNYVKAALSLGASPASAFWKVYFPLTYPVIGAAGMLVFALSLGNYVLPLVLGGSADQMVSSFISLFTVKTSNEPMAAALSVWLLAATICGFSIYGYMLSRSRTR
ncbi:ABC transporter permease subunit [Rhizobium sp. BK491]|uniref:ABC transporter permease subunit n=1 Tax=Rhizobium sp. BK491 TaxID=2587009 RepID=UPI00160A14C5|nr:ABC transporter permease subunit [Rhizobium sp. BK491]MBB3571913.1 putative spermidine/putrescine transport system permease protein [Rhizobium sp. BK491]